MQPCIERILCNAPPILDGVLNKDWSSGVRDRTRQHTYNRSSEACHGGGLSIPGRPSRKRPPKPRVNRHEFSNFFALCCITRGQSNKRTQAYAQVFDFRSHKCSIQKGELVTEFVFSPVDDPERLRQLGEVAAAADLAESLGIDPLRALGAFTAGIKDHLVVADDGLAPGHQLEIIQTLGDLARVTKGLCACEDTLNTMLLRRLAMATCDLLSTAFVHTAEDAEVARTWRRAYEEWLEK